MQFNQKRAQKAFKQGVVMKWRYGFKCHGMAPTSRRSMRAEFSKRLGWSPGVCSTSLISLMAPGEDPDVDVSTRTVLGWISLWRDSAVNAISDRVSRTWHTIQVLQESLGDGQAWNRILGPI